MLDLDVVIPLWAHVVLLLAALGVCAYVAERGWRREDGLRRKLGGSRSALAAAEIQRDLHRRESMARLLHIRALEAEVARYRILMPPDLRVTQVMQQEPESE